jgi:hypothetical protein
MKFFLKYPLIALLIAVITTACSNKLYECNSDQAKQKLEMADLIISSPRDKLRTELTALKEIYESPIIYLKNYFLVF